MNKALWTVNGTRRKKLYDPAVEEEMKRLVKRREADVASAEADVAYAREKMADARTCVKSAKWRLKEANRCNSHRKELS